MSPYGDSVFSFQDTSPGDKKNIASGMFRRYVLYVMDTEFLESFVKVVEHGSVAEAARRLNLTAAAVTQRIRALEREIGTISGFPLGPQRARNGSRGCDHGAGRTIIARHPGPAHHRE